MLKLDNLYPLALGCNNIGLSLSDKVVRSYIKNGGNVFDTALAYQDGNSEKQLSKYLKEFGRENFFVITKGCFYDKKTFTSRVNKKDLLSDIKRSLENLDINKIDLYLLHRDDEDLSVKEIVDFTSDLVDKGYTRYIGVSNWSLDRFNSALDYALKNNKHCFLTNQVQFSLAITSKDIWDDQTINVLSLDDIKKYNENNILITTYSSTARGVLDKINNNLGFAKHFETDQNIKIAEKALIVAKQLNLSCSSLSLSYIRSCLSKSLCIISPSSTDQLDDCINALKYKIDPKIRNYLRDK